ncbi:YoaK family protein [Stakelama marina]|uniref:DUF1275 domain-containing protein n=1 Tax=Stakelama marina TaxID=2826939 RepID=A0A8T4IKM0_9SPHN|nr:YoaK family protein [Stakelama marina]MBR0552909.1 DUF1275 domain-containing protein [Stakelama marina]
MQRYPMPVIGVAILLAALAGFVDALAYASLGGFFASFMSGNTTRIGVSLGTSEYRDAVIAGSLILSFLSGVVLSSVINHAWPRWKGVSVMVAVTLLLAAAAVTDWLGPRPVALLFLAAAMGAENGVFAFGGHIRINITYMTGTLVRFGQKLGCALMGVGGRWEWLRDLLLWVGFFCGVLGGSFTFTDYGEWAFWAAPAAAAVLTLIIALLPRRHFQE